MPFNPINFLNAPVSRHPLHGLIEALSQGYQTGQMPARMQEEQQQRQLANQFAQMRNQQEPQRFSSEQEGKELSNIFDRLRNKQEPERFANQQEASKAGIELSKAQTEDYRSPFHQLGKFSGSGKDAIELETIKNVYGENSQTYKRAEKSYNDKSNMQNALVDYRSALTNTADKRAAAQLGKLGLEKNEVEEGYLPGSNRTIRISPEEQKQLIGRYDLQQQKISSDVDTRKRSLFASNIDKTLNSINVNDLTQYAGLSGKLEQKLEQGKAMTGDESKKYDAFQKALVGSQLLAKQVRQFYGDSITPQVQEKLGQLTNPSTWSNNPKIAKQNFEQFANILKKETETYRSSLKNTSEFSSNSGATKLYSPDGKSYTVPNDKLDAVLQKHPDLKKGG